MTHTCHDCGTTRDVKHYFCQGCDKKTLGHFSSICMECSNNLSGAVKRSEHEWLKTGYSWQARKNIE